MLTWVRTAWKSIPGTAAGSLNREEEPVLPKFSTVKPLAAKPLGYRPAANNECGINYPEIPLKTAGGKNHRWDLVCKT